MRLQHVCFGQITLWLTCCAKMLRYTHLHRANLHRSHSTACPGMVCAVFHRQAYQGRSAGHPCHPLSRRLVRDCALAGPKRDAVGVLKARGLACCGHGCWWWWGCSQQLLSTGMAARGLQRSPQASAASDVSLPSPVWPQSGLSPISFSQSRQSPILVC